jgi:hypothetical protein
MTTRDLCLAGAKRPEGVRAQDIGIPRTTASVNFRKLVAMGLIYAGGTPMEMRYFDNKEAADAFTTRMRVDRAPPKRSHVPMGHKARPTKAGWGPDDPARITSKTKVTICPTPVPALYTNTYSRY